MKTRTLLTIIFHEKEKKHPTFHATWTETFGVSLEFKLPDLWIGAFWLRSKRDFDLWICLLPCLPIHFFVRK